jgi:hypothetical protein
MDMEVVDGLAMAEMMSENVGASFELRVVEQ